MTATLTGRTRYRVGGILRRVLVLQVEVEWGRYVDGTRWPPRFEPTRSWRDATLEDLTAQPDRERKTSRPPMPPSRND